MITKATRDGSADRKAQRGTVPAAVAVRRQMWGEDVRVSRARGRGEAEEAADCDAGVQSLGWPAWCSGAGTARLSVPFRTDVVRPLPPFRGSGCRGEGWDQPQRAGPRSLQHGSARRGIKYHVCVYRQLTPRGHAELVAGMCVSKLGLWDKPSLYFDGLREVAGRACHGLRWVQ